MTDDMIAVGRIALHPGVLDYADADGKVVLYVQDSDEGRSLFMSISMYGEFSRTYEVRYDDFADVVTRMMGQVTLANAEDPFTQLVLGGTDG